MNNRHEWEHIRYNVAQCKHCSLIRVNTVDGEGKPMVEYSKANEYIGTTAGKCIERLSEKEKRRLDKRKPKQLAFEFPDMINRNNDVLSIHSDKPF